MGVAGSLDQTDLNVFHNLIWVDAIRGADNTGVVSVSRGSPDSWDVVKVEGDTAQLFDHRRYDKVVTKDRSLIIGHNRSKTIGDTKHKNAHPFSFEHITGVHNGTLAYDARRRLEEAGHKFDTDSEQLYSHMNEHGIEKTITKMEGAWSLVWYDKRNKTVNFLRNKERPMVYCFNDAHTTLYWASEVAMLYLCLNRFAVPFGNQKESKPFYLTEDTLISWAIPHFNQTFEKPTRQKMEAPKSFPLWSGTTMMGPGTGTQQNMNYGSNNATAGTARRFETLAAHRQAMVARLTSSTSSQSSGVAAQSPIMQKIDDLSKIRLSTLQMGGERPFYHTHSKDITIDQAQFEIKMLDGCSNCSVQPVWGEPIKFCRDGTFICAECMLLDKDDIATIASDM